ncbi:MAG: TadE/TadG family type IV pilus assembly protein [Ignavibacteriales bacterium]
MHNKRGQVLITFILLLPILFMLAAIIIDGGLLFNEKRKVDNTVKEALEYGVDHIDEAEIITNIKKLINQNISDIKTLNVQIDGEIIIIELKKIKDSIFSFIFGKNDYNIESNYRAYEDNNDIVIKEE